LDDKLVWFLAPTVALCHQHYKTILANLPAYQTRLLTSEDGVDRWTDQTIWDGVLKNMKIIVSTYGVLYDALCHGFIAMQRLSLCIFDEAHHCTKKHASNMIMQHFYRPAKAAGSAVPRILGLSASPVMNAKAGGLEVLEANMDSRAITPRLHRSELMQYVHVPELLKRSFSSRDVFDLDISSSLLGGLTDIIRQYDIRKDPYVLGLVQAAGADMQANVHNVLTSQKTYCTDQLRALRSRAEVIARDVSLSASETYIQSCRDKFLTGVQQHNTSFMPELSDKEKVHLAGILTGLRVNSVNMDTTLSSKLQLLLDVLREEAGPSFTGIVFVEQRAVVAALAEHLISMPELSRLFNIGTFVGGSNSTKKKANIGDINDLKAQQQTLDDFRIGKKNLIIATSVLEEGIDISSCQTVICFDAPLNLVSFVQRRGRARKRDSKYIILLSDDDSKGEPAKWQQLEDKMKAAYEDESRNAQLAAQLESTHEADGRKYVVPETGAVLTLDNAKSHLYHFCATLRTTTHQADHRPVFDCQTDAEGLLITAKVVLPSGVNKKYRNAVSAHGWRTERAAMKDAAFEACVSLHRGGLLNDHLLPLLMQTPDQARQDRPGLIQVAKRIDAWSLGTPNSCFKHVVEVDIEGRGTISMAMFLPLPCPLIEEIRLHWSISVAGVARVYPGRACVLGDEEIATRQKDTETLLLSVSFPGSLAHARGNYAAMFGPLDDTFLSRDRRSALEILSAAQSIRDVGLVHVNGEEGRSYILEKISGQDQQTLQVTAFPKKRDFLSKPAGESKRNRHTRLELSASQCTINALAAKYSIFAALIPTLLYKTENSILATHLQQTLLHPIGIKNLDLIIEATTSGNADFTASYERLEYLGDAVLKFCTHVQLAAQHPEWPESYLTVEKGRTNGNASLSRAAVRSGVDRYINTTKFTGNNWKPPLLSAACSAENDSTLTVTRSTKTLADVIEALIGASYVDQGLSGALCCIRIFLPQEQWLDHSTCLSLLQSQTPCLPPHQTPSFLKEVEALIGHVFSNPALLLEALTHCSFSSCSFGSSSSILDTASYERLEFLGDAVLDQILVPAIFEFQDPPLKNHEMHRLRQALANAHVLAICNLELRVQATRLNPITMTTTMPGKEEETTTTKTKLQESTQSRHLTDYLRCSPQTHLQRIQTHATYHDKTNPHHHCKKMRDSLLTQLHSAQTYPWPDFLRLKAPKFYSDMLEAILGAIHVDSCGDLDACRGFVRKLGLMGLMDRFVDEGVGIGFPRERLGGLVNSAGVEYRAFVVGDGGDGEVEMDEGKDEGVEADEGKWACEVFVDGRKVAEVSKCCSREEAEVRCAVEAVRVLQEGVIGGMDAKMVDILA
jgi:ERCC4-related helicase/dsRNA-specific ribonuclease